MLRSARALAVMLTIVMVASVLPIGFCCSEVSVGETPDPTSQPSDLTLVKDGMSITLHRLTADDVNDMRSVMGVKDPNRNYNVQVDGMGTGLAPPSEAEYDLMEGQYSIVKAEYNDLGGGLPSSFDLSTLNTFPKVGNQGSQGSCAAWAMTYYCYGAIEAADNGWTSAKSGMSSQLISPAWTYNRVSDYDHGSSMTTNGWVIRDWGVPTLATMPYVASDCTSWGSEAAMREAPLHRASSVISISDVSTDAIKAIVQSGKPVTFALDANQYSACFSDNGASKIISAAEYTPNTPNHAQTIVGWNDTITDDETGAFRVVNSWGTSWGESGYYWITYAAFAEAVAQWTPNYIDDLADYTPSMIATWHYDSAPGRDTAFTIRLQNNNTGATVASRTYYYQKSFSNGATPKHPNYMAVDISDFASSYSATNSKFAIEFSGGSSQGTISSFRVERYEGGYSSGQATHISRQSSGLPKTTSGTVTTFMSPYTKLTYPEALDSSGLTYSSTGSARWVSEVHQSMNGGDALQSGDIPDGQSSRLATSVTGPCNIEFEWKVSSESGDNYMVSLDGVAQSTISGATNWAHIQIAIASGSHSVEWSFSKNSVNSRNDDCAYLDKVFLSSGGGGDVTPPSTNIALDGTVGNNGWYKSSVTVTLSASDASGITATYYRLNGGSWQTYSTPFAISTDGSTQVEFYSVDSVSNTESVQSSTVKVDHTAPTTSSSLSSYTVTLIPSDATSGVYRTFFRVDGGAWSLYTASFSAGTSGQHSVDFNATDNAGNIEITKQIQVGTADTTPPTTTASLAGTSGQNGWYLSSVTVTLAASDSSGIASRNYRIDGGSWTSYGSAFAVVTEGSHTIEFYSVDGVGNTETVKSVNLKIDSIKPSTSSSVTSYTVTLSSNDATSGVYRTFYRIDSSAWTLYGASFIAGSSGQHVVQFNSTDNAGNVEATKQVTVGSSDSSPPITTASLAGTSGKNGWYTSSVTVTLTATDSGGVASRLYRIDSGSWTTYSAAFSVSTEGNHIVEFYSIDNAGNTEGVKSVNLKIDTVKPNTSSSVSLYTVSLSADDATSGVYRTFYRIDTGAWTLYGSSFSAGTSGQHTVQFNSTDSAGNVEVTKQVTVGSSDSLPPTTTASLTGTSGLNGWYVGSVTITLTATDSGGVASRHYRIDSGSWTTYSAPFSVSNEGNHIVEFYSIDNAGNTEGVRSLNLKIDSVKPISSSSVSSYSVTLAASDATSGVDDTYYRVGPTGSYSLYTAPFNAGSIGQVYTVYYYSTDNAGNTETARTVQVGTADTTPPSTTVTLTGTLGGSGWFTSSVTVTLASSDNVAVQRTFYRWQGATTWNTYSSALSTSSEGDRVLEYYSVDTFGNSETTKSVHIKIDRTAPTSSSSLSGGTVTLSATDARSGVSYIEYRIDSGSWVTYSGPFTLTPLWESHSVEFRAKDIAGNQEVIRSRTVGTDDTNAPTTSAAPLGPAGSSGWYLGGVSVTLTASDSASGPDQTWYALDGGPWTRYNGPVPISSQGNHQLLYYSIDLAGNVETQRSLTVSIDSGSPSTVPIVDNGMVSLSGSDATSGIASILYRFDSGTDFTYAGLVTIPDPYQDHTLYYHGVDVAGNVEGEHSLFIPASNGTDLLPPGPPSGPQVILSDGMALLSWQAPVDDGGSTILGYKVYRGASSGDEIFLASTPSQQYTDASVTLGQTYYYTIKANNSIGDSMASEEAFLLVASSPSAPLDLVLVTHPGEVEVSWSAPLSDGGLALSGYLLKRGTTSGSTDMTISLNSTTLSYQDVDVKEGMTYYYRVSAVNAIGESEDGKEASALAPYHVGPPLSFTVQLKGDTVNVSWLVPDGSSPSGYRVFRSTGTGSPELLVDVTVLHYNDTDLVAGQTYHYCVAALYGVEMGPRSGELSVTIPAEVPELPAVPEDLVGMASPDGIGLDWTYAHPDRDQLIGFKVYRSTMAGMGYAALLTTCNATTYVDESALAGVTYYYQVKALNQAGEGPASKVVSASRPADAGSLPGLPEGLNVTVEGAQVTISWSAPLESGSAGLLGYRLYRSTEEGSPKLLATVGGLSYVDDTTLPDRTYQYCVSTYNAIGESGMAGPASISRTRSALDDPMMPQAMAVRMSLGQVELSWEMPADMPVHYCVYRGSSPDDMVLIATLDGDVQSYIDQAGWDGAYYSVTPVFEDGIGPGTPAVMADGTSYESDLPGTGGSILSNPFFWVGMVGLFVIAFVVVRMATRRGR